MFEVYSLKGSGDWGKTTIASKNQPCIKILKLNQNAEKYMVWGWDMAVFGTVGARISKEHVLDFNARGNWNQQTEGQIWRTACSLIITPAIYMYRIQI